MRGESVRMKGLLRKRMMMMRLLRRELRRWKGVKGKVVLSLLRVKPRRWLDERDIDVYKTKLNDFIVFNFKEINMFHQYWKSSLISSSYSKSWNSPSSKLFSL